MGLLRLFVPFVMALSLVAGSARAADGAGLTIFAASSLTQVLDEVAKAYLSEGGGPVRMNYAASSALARQIEQAGGADIFISADLDWMDYLGQRNLIRPESRTILASNRLVLVTPAAAPDAVLDPAAPDFGAKLLGQLGTKDRLAMADPDFVPAGRYGKAALMALGAWAQAETRIARAENVRAALLLVARGEAPVGIVYETDAALDRAVKIAGRFPEKSHPPILYPAAMTAGSANPAAAQKFLDFLRSAKAQAIFARFGFPPAPKQ